MGSFVCRIVDGAAFRGGLVVASAVLLIERSDVVFCRFCSFVVGLMDICSFVEVEMANELSGGSDVVSLFADRLEDEGSFVERLEDTDVAGCDVVNSFVGRLGDVSVLIKRSDVVSSGWATVGSFVEVLTGICSVVDGLANAVLGRLDVVDLFGERLEDVESIVE